MNTTIEHSFPLPDLELHKLDKLGGKLHNRWPLETSAAFLKANPWTSIALAGAAGILAVLLVKSRSS